MSLHLNQQLYQKNTLLRSYEHQAQQLKSLLNKQRSHQYLKLPKESSMINAVNRLEAENLQLKAKLNEMLQSNSGLVNKAQKEVVFNRKLQQENVILKEKLSDVTRLLEAERNASMTQEILTGAASSSLKNHNSPPTRQSSQPNPTLPSRYPTQPNDLVIRTLQMQKTQTQLQKEIQYLNNQLAKCQQQLHLSQKQVKILKQKVLELQEANHQAFVLKQNDQLAGELAKTVLLKESLEFTVQQIRDENSKKTKQIQELRVSFNKQIANMNISHQSHTPKQSSHHDKDASLKDSRSEFKGREMSKQKKNSLSNKDPASNHTSVYKSQCLSLRNSIQDHHSHKQSDQNESRDNLSSNSNSLKKQTKKQYEKQLIKKDINRQYSESHRGSKLSSIQNSSHHRKQSSEQEFEKVSRPSIKKTEQSYYLLEDVSQLSPQKQIQSKRQSTTGDYQKRNTHSVSQTEIQKEKSLNDIYDRLQSQRQEVPNFQNSLLPRKNIRTQVEENEQQEGFWNNFMKKIF